MPTLLDAADVFSKLGKKSVEIREAACVRVRHRHASCHACMQVCAHEAIAIENNVLSLDHALCTGCGACATVCPTEALVLIDDANALVDAAIDAATPGDTITIVCDHLRNLQGDGANKAVKSESSEAALPLAFSCLACLDESTTIHAACAGVVLRFESAACARCPNANATLIGDIIEQATHLLEALPLHLTGRLVRPAWDVEERAAVAKRADVSPEMSRRGMFDHLVARTTDSVAEAAVGTFYVTRASSSAPPTLAQSLMESRGTMKTISVARTTRILDDLYRFDPQLAEPAAEDRASAIVPTRLFGEIALDTARCDLCGICMTFCPTAAITGTPNPPVNPFVAATREVELTGELNFRANDCVACGLCEDICPRNAIEMRSGICRTDLFALEPAVLFKR